MVGPGDETAAAEGRSRGDLRASHADREQVIGALKAAFVQGRLTEDELGARAGQAYTSRTYAELAEVTADIPAGLLAQLPTPTYVRLGVCLTIAAAIVVTAVLLWQPDNALAFMAFVVSALTVLVAPVITVGLILDVRHQKRSGGQR
jgi:uncharacterized protein DUF1707